MQDKVYIGNSEFSSVPRIRGKKSSIWSKIYPIFSILIPNGVLKFCGMKSKEIRNAWREKIALVSIIFLLCCLLGFLTFGINRVVCKGNNQFIYGNLPKFNDQTVVGNGELYYCDEAEGLVRNLKTKTPTSCKRFFGKQITDEGLDPSNMIKISDIYFNFSDIKKLNLIAIEDKVYDPTIVTHNYFDDFIKQYTGKKADGNNLDPDALKCFKDACYFGKIADHTYGCIVADVLLYLSTVIIFSIIALKFLLAFLYSWYISGKTYISRVDRTSAGRMSRQNAIQNSNSNQTNDRIFLNTIMLVTCYSEDREGIKNTLDSLCDQNYDNKLILVIADGLIKGSGSDATTPDIIIDLMTVYHRSEASEYQSLNGTLNRGIVYTGTYTSSTNNSSDPSNVSENQLNHQRNNNTCKMMAIVKVGREDEKTKPGNRGKRDSQVIIMGFMNKLLYSERMTDLEYAMYESFIALDFNPMQLDIILMVDADTIVHQDALLYFNSAFVNDTKIMGMCGETKIINKASSWVTMIQVFEYYISHHLTKTFESVFGGVTCLPGCFCIYRIFINENGTVTPIVSHPAVLNAYSITKTETLHDKNLLLLGEDRYLTTLLLKTFSKRKLIFLPKATCRTFVPDTFRVLLSQRRRWINSTVHNLMELVSVKSLCGTFCCSMQFAVGVELVGTLVLPVSIFFTFVLIIVSILGKPAWIPLIMLACILGLPAILILITSFRLQYIFWLIIYIFSLPVWNFILPVYSFWHFDDFSWGETRKVEGEEKTETENVDVKTETRLFTLNEREYAKSRGRDVTELEDELIQKSIRQMDQLPGGPSQK
ncbi:Chitin synthase/hyaluronan synthase (glycosyltransferases) [Pseudoloma neurophilia]|uniref:chitin synthase n=1 Tax=Pseudoloma neurophilia TaxID=146866 RepID=A0A0R0M076_9MICR|nr:Chitin synthase/hyaluronan synthase (glycosyltransferases) [Pseudoloma neurophilia]